MTRAETTTTTRHYIQHVVPGIRIAGDMEQWNATEPTQGRKIALILHGAMGHKDYLFQKKLAKQLPIDSFRFDFRANHETPGTWNIANFEDDLEDLRIVGEYLTKQLGYQIAMIVAHSRATFVSSYWICNSEWAKSVEAFVNVSGRYRMNKIFDRTNHELYGAQFKERGFYEWKTRVAGKPVVGIIRPEDVSKFGAWDNSYLWTEFPQHIDVLTIHGFRDDVVPPYDAIIYARVYSSRSPGTHTLHMIEGADHNFIGHFEKVIETVLGWWALRGSGNLKTGIWNTGVRGKL
ncbi:hypothetical protein SISSUDRAFT_1045541 [Sistotremastrum suecicum HHB10207 ss-3]|uniref:Ectomycorrhiza-regulated esterase n=1 Tax=Sistotremastrum suecicum HHB10207 ss-3 TaxID=1314776 RepID=A0A166EEN0_9AGAM|nr:hypothetical protein SISSUDRAFT_1045541 [Sistotremastrum suecicum HHB10207 ss-3]